MTVILVQLKLLVKLLKRETKQLQNQVAQTTKPPDHPAGSSQPGGDGGGSDSDNPPWERRKLEARLAECESVIREKNTHIEQLLRDCRQLETDKEQSAEQMERLSRQLDDCTRELQIATHNYAALEETYKGDVPSQVI